MERKTAGPGPNLVKIRANSASWPWVPTNKPSRASELGIYEQYLVP